MNKSQIEKILNNKFGRVDFLANSLIRCQKIENQRPYSVFYFDLEENIPRNKIELKSYQDKLIAEQYYAQQNDLRWNSYLVFVLSQEKYEEASESGLRAIIEQDKIYTRKHIIRESELSEFSDFFKDQYSPQGTSIDLSSTWISSLEEAGLTDILSTKRKSTVIENILSGEKPFPDFEIGTGGNDEDARTGFISTLTLDKYDPFPKVRDHHFSDVNLIFGKNGAGKSSLLEAIEFCLCGETRRERSADHMVTIKYRGSDNIEISEPGNHDKHKYRDLKWYGRTVLRGSDLSTSFNRYNFYNTDAAFLLGERKSEEDLIDAFSSLAFGEKTNVIEKKVEKYQGDFEKEISSTKDFISLLNKQLEEASQEMEAKGKLGPMLSGYIYDLQTFLSDKTFVTERLGEKAENLEIIKNQIADFNGALKDIIRKAFWLEKITIENVSSSETILRDNLSKLKDLVRKYDNIKGHIVSLKKASSQNEKRVSILQRAYIMAREESLSLLKDLEKNHVELKRKVNLLTEVEQLISANDYEIISDLDNTSSVFSLIHETSKEIESGHREIANKRSDLNSAKEKADHISSLIIEIQVLGGQLIQQNNDIKDCPLCGHYHENGLIPLVTDTKDSATLRVIESLEKSLIGIDKKNKENLKQLRALESIDQINSILDWKERSLIPLKENINSIKSEISQKDTLGRNLTELEGLKKRFEANGITQESFEKTSIEMAQEFPQVSITNQNLHIIQNLLGDLKEEAENKAKELQSRMSEYEDLVAEKEKLKSVLDSNLGGAEDLSAEITRRLSTIDSLKHSITSLQIMSGVNPSADLMELSNTASICVEKISDLNRLKDQESTAKVEVLKLKAKIEEINKDIKNRRLRLKKAEEALEVINMVLDEDKKREALNEILTTNLKLINWIFGKIHAPREFKELDPQSLKLIREHDGKKHKLDQISTGQRSALALSVFLSLNLSSVYSPPQILLDDPVAHVDDLNTLSFFDFLRELALRGKRQIFFATANEKLADLFEKKFRFLGEEKFKRINLSRNDRGA